MAKKTATKSATESEARETNSGQPAGESADSGALDDDLLDEDGKQLSFEGALEALEALVVEMEDGELSLEASLKSYQRGVKLHAYCQRALTSAEQTIQILTGAAEGELEDFDAVSTQPGHEG